jgi:hypothetical protein
LDHRLVDDVEPIKVVGDLLFGARRLGEAFGDRDLLWARNCSDLGAVQRHDTPTDEPFSRQNCTKVALAAMIASGLSCGNAAMVR